MQTDQNSLNIDVFSGPTSHEPLLSTDALINNNFFKTQLWEAAKKEFFSGRTTKTRTLFLRLPYGKLFLFDFIILYIMMHSDWNS